MPADHAGAPRRTALVTGANRGIGLAVCRRLAVAGHEVVLAARHPARGREAARRLAGEGLAVRDEQLDVTDPDSVADCARRLEKAGVTVDVLVNNAGTYPTTSFFSVSEQLLRDTLDVHLMGAFRACQVFVPGMAERGWGRVVNVSSTGGQLTGSTPGPAAYGIAKAALNALTLVVAAAVPPTVKVNAVCPGWVRTAMGGSGAPLSPDQGADTVSWLALLPDDGPSGGFFHERRRIAW